MDTISLLFKNIINYANQKESNNARIPINNTTTLTVLLNIGTNNETPNQKLHELLLRAQSQNYLCTLIMNAPDDSEEFIYNNDVKYLFTDSLQFAMKQSRYQESSIIFIDNSNGQFADILKNVLNIICNDHKHVFVANNDDTLINYADKVKYIKQFQLPKMTHDGQYKSLISKQCK